MLGKVLHRISLLLQVNCVRRIIRVQGWTSNPGGLFSKPGLQKLSAYLEEVATTGSPKSALIYYDHFRSLLNFLEDQERIDELQCKQVRTQMKKWRLKLHGKSKQQQRSQSKPLEVAKVRTMLRGRTVMTAKRILQSARATGSPFTPTEAVTVRDSIWLNLIASNACRPGELANMEVSELDAAEQIEDYYVIKVFKHKTSTTFGPAQLIVSQEVFEAMLTYRRLRPQPLDGCTKLFLTRSLGPTNVTLVAHCLNREYKGNQRVRCSMVRRLVTTSVHRFKGPESIDLCARKLNHSPATAMRWYKEATSPADALAGAKLVIEALNVADLL